MSYAAMPATAGGYDYAGFWWRVLASIIDNILTTVMGAILGAIAGAVFITPLLHAGQPDAVAHVLMPIRGVALVLSAADYIVFECSALRATPGKLICRLAVVDRYGRQIGFLRSAGRFFGKYISALILGIGFMMAGWTERKQGLNDKMAGCLVVRKTSPNGTDIRLPDFA